MAKMSFEEKLEKSKDLIDKLMNPEITLEESIKIYKEGLETIKKAQKMLEDAKLKIEEISKENIGDES
jgi:exodeoxyribonuclease VII small subunit